MICILIGIAGFVLVLAAFRPDQTPEHELVPILVDPQFQR